MDETIMQKMTATWRSVKAWGERIGPELLFAFLLFVALLGMVLFITLIAVMFSDYVACWAEGILDTKDKRDTIQFIGLGIAGVLAVFGSVAVSRRSAAQVKVADAQVKNNELVEKGHIQERFKAAVEHLGNGGEMARIASFYELFYLARDNEDLRKNILDILCAHLRQTTNDKEYDEKIVLTDKEGKDSEIRPTEEVESLLDVLFQPKGQQRELIFTEFRFNLRGVFLMGARLRQAKMRGAKLRGADLRFADLQLADLHNAKMRNVDLRGADLRRANLQGVKHLETAKLSGTKVKDAILPEGFEWPADVNHD